MVLVVDILSNTAESAYAGLQRSQIRYPWCIPVESSDISVQSFFFDLFEFIDCII